jgi:hypothetical protein
MSELKEKSWRDGLNEFIDEKKKTLVRYPKAPDGDGFPGYIWDSKKKVLDYLVEKHGKKEAPKYCYTLVTGDDDCAYILSGWRYVNRFGWLVSKEPVEEDVEIRYW